MKGGVLNDCPEIPNDCPFTRLSCCYNHLPRAFELRNLGSGEILIEVYLLGRDKSFRLARRP